MLKSFNNTGDVFTSLDGSDAQDDRFARELAVRQWRWTSAVGNHSDPRWLDVQQLFHLARGEGRDGDDQIGTLGGSAGLRGEALAEIGGRVITRHHEQIVKCGDAAA